jgi:hypothetical protein
MEIISAHPSPAGAQAVPVAWIAQSRWDRMTNAEPWLTNVVYSEDQAPSFDCIPLYAAPPAVPSDVQDTWFADRSLPVMAMSGDVESDRVLKLHFRRPVTDADRQEVVNALNLHRASLEAAPAAPVGEDR